MKTLFQLKEKLTIAGMLLWLSTLQVAAQNYCAKVDYTHEVNGLEVRFEGSSPETVQEWYWYYGDNTPVAKGQKQNHTFTKEGTYDVCLKILVNESCTGAVCRKISIGTTTSPCDLKPDFQYTVSGNQVKFSGTSTVGDNGKYYWSFGNGKSGEGREVSSGYVADGYYEVCMKVLGPAISTSTSPCTDGICKKIKIGNGCDLKAEFTFAHTGSDYTFKANSNAGSDARYYWSFGNGVSAEGQQVTNTYSTPGFYEVCLKVLGGPSTTAAGQCVQSVCKKIQVGQDIQDCVLEADFKYTANGNQLTFRASSNDDKATYYWYGSDFSAANLTGREVTHVFQKDGIYEVCLVAVDGGQTCKVKVCKKVTVGDNIKVFPNPTSDFINFVSERRIIKAGIFDQMNKHMLVSEVNNTEGRIDVSGLVSGLYSVKLVLEDQSVHVATFYKN